MTELELLKNRVTEIEKNQRAFTELMKEIVRLLGENKRDLRTQEINLHTIRLLLEKDEQNGRLM